MGGAASAVSCIGEGGFGRKKASFHGSSGVFVLVGGDQLGQDNYLSRNLVIILSFDPPENGP